MKSSACSEALGPKAIERITQVPAHGPFFAVIGMVMGSWWGLSSAQNHGRWDQVHRATPKTDVASTTWKHLTDTQNIQGSAKKVMVPSSDTVGRSYRNHRIPPHTSDYHLFGPLKWHLSGKPFNTDDFVVAELQGWLRSLDGHSLSRVFKCSCANGTSVPTSVVTMWKSSRIVPVTYAQCFTCIILNMSL